VIAGIRPEASEVRAGAEGGHGARDVRRLLFAARVDPGTSARPGTPLRLAVDPSRFHYFNPETGLRFEPERALTAVAT
jgi:hypothetical protein